MPRPRKRPIKRPKKRPVKRPKKQPKKRPKPTKKVIQIAAGGEFSLVLVNDGTVWAWGWNKFGQLGIGSEVDKNRPTKLSITGVKKIACGARHSLALMENGKVMSWGTNFNGNLGDGTRDQRNAPGSVLFLEDIIDIAAGFNSSFAIRSDGTLWSWGHNLYGQLGDGTTETQMKPVKSPHLSDIKAITAGYRHAMALKSDGTVWAWGYNKWGQVGNGITWDESYWDREVEPTPGKVKRKGSGGNIVNLTDIIAIACGSWHSMALKGNGTVWTWGRDYWGCLGVSTYSDDATNIYVREGGGRSIDRSTTTTAMKVGGPGGEGFLTGIKAIAAGNEHSLAIRNSDGNVFAWGAGHQGQLGWSTGSLSRDDSKSWPTPTLQISDATSVKGGRTHSLGLTKEDQVWVWGGNHYGQLGDKTNSNRYEPVKITVLKLLPLKPGPRPKPI